MAKAHHPPDRWRLITAPLRHSYRFAESPLQRRACLPADRDKRVAALAEAVADYY